MQPATSVSERFRLYIDESGDHVFREVQSAAHRYLCLLGCWFQHADYIAFHAKLEALKSQHLKHHPDEPVVLHREDMLHARGSFSALRDEAARVQWDNALLDLVRSSNFRIVAVVIDKHALLESFGDTSAHPYHLGLGFMLQRYVGYLNLRSYRGDVMAESRGGKEDRLLKDSYQHIYDRGAWMVSAEKFQSALSSRQLKVKSKQANIAGLQLADLLGHPVKQWVLREHGRIDKEPSAFAAQLLECARAKFNCHLSTQRIDGYGTVLYPKK